MYVVLKNGRSSIRRLFATYEQARQATRKLVRKDPFWALIRAGSGDNPPTLDFFGYSIRKVA